MRNNNLEILFLRIDTGRYHLLKFLLEGYDGLAILTKLQGEIVFLRYPTEAKKDLFDFLASVAVNIRTNL